MNHSELMAEIKRLKKEKNVLILAHYYQDSAIQEIADFVGDSYFLSLKAAQTKADIILFSGVHFMAETAKILNPKKKVILPDINAGCSLADSCRPEEFRKFKENYPEHITITYINCSAEIKSLSDIICTSSNAKRIIESIPKTKNILFAPDKNLGKYLEKVTGRKMVLWDGTCTVHDSFSFDKLLKLMGEYPMAILVAHPESTSDVLEIANFIGSTSEIINFVKQSKDKVFLVASEIGILHKMKEAVPNRTLIPVPTAEDNTCACSECAYMKVNTLEKVYLCLLNESPTIELPENIIQAAKIPIDRMIQITEAHV